MSKCVQGTSELSAGGMLIRPCRASTALGVVALGFMSNALLMQRSASPFVGGQFAPGVIEAQSMAFAQPFVAPTPEILALPPAPRRSVFTYTPDGSYRISSGPLPNPYFQSRLMAVIPKFAAYGFGRYVSMTYQGNARSLADATGYYDPIVSVANANGVQFVPGFWMADIFANVYGPEDLPPWNVGVGSYNHPMNPSGLLNPAFWTEFVTRAEILAKGAHSTQVFVEAEGVFWYHKEEPFWSNANLAQIKPLFRQAVADLRSRGVTLIMYHPWPIYTVDVCVRQTQYLLSPNNPADPADPMNCVEHFAPSPYFRVTNYTPPEPADIIGYYTIVGLSGEYVRYGFMSNHAGSHCFTPQQYHDWCVARPGVEDKTWYFSGTSLFEQHAEEFLNIANSRPPGRSGDIDGDGDLDATDVALFRSVLLKTETNPVRMSRSDLNGNGQADGDDIRMFVNEFLITQHE